MTLGEKIYSLRKEKNISQEQLAYELEVSKTAVLKWENNQTKPKTESMIRLCDYFGVEMGDLISDSKVDFTNAQFKNNTFAGYAENLTINNTESPEIIEMFKENNKKIFELLELNNKIMEKLVK